MGIKKFTIVLIPEGCTKVKNFRVPRFLVALFVLSLFLCLAYLGLIIRDYQKIKPQMLRLAQLQRENDLQKRQFVRLVERINQFTQEMGTIQELNHRLRIMVNLEMGEDNGQSHGVGGSDPDFLPVDYSSAQSYRRLVRLMHRSVDTLNLKIALDRRNKTELQTFFEEQKGVLASTPSIWPIKGWLTSRFGRRLSPFTGDKEFHNGIDISARRNAPIIATANGVVSSVGRERLAGRVVYINHGYGLVTKYAHLQKILVKEGQYVKRGERVALVGSSGRSTGPHLHYEVLLNGVPTNPLNYILN